jgi:hypothetical protein
MSVYFPNLDPNLLVKKPHQRNADTKFPWKLHRMLKDVEQQGLTKIVGWHDDGLCFKVHDPDAFTKQILPLHFREAKYRSFQRQLNLYGFQRITAVKPIWDSCYYHPEFQREVCQGGCPKVNRPHRNTVEKSISLGRDYEGTPNQGRSASVEIADLRVHEDPPPNPGQDTELPTNEVIQAEVTSKRQIDENFDDSVGNPVTVNALFDDNLLDSKIFGCPDPSTPTRCLDQSTVHAFIDINAEGLNQCKEDHLDDEELFERIDRMAMNRRDSYQDLYETIMGPDWQTCDDHEKLMAELLNMFPAED